MRRRHGGHAIGCTRGQAAWHDAKVARHATVHGALHGALRAPVRRHEGRRVLGRVGSGQVHRAGHLAGGGQRLRRGGVVAHEHGLGRSGAAVAQEAGGGVDGAARGIHRRREMTGAARSAQAAELTRVLLGQVPLAHRSHRSSVVQACTSRNVSASNALISTLPHARQQQPHMLQVYE